MTRRPLFVHDPSEGYVVPENPGNHYYVVPQDSTGCAVCGGGRPGHLGEAPAVSSKEQSLTDRAISEDVSG